MLLTRSRSSTGASPSSLAGTDSSAVHPESTPGTSVLVIPDTHTLPDGSTADAGASRAPPRPALSLKGLDIHSSPALKPDLDAAGEPAPSSIHGTPRRRPMVSWRRQSWAESIISSSSSSNKDNPQQHGTSLDMKPVPSNHLKGSCTTTATEGKFHLGVSKQLSLFKSRGNRHQPEDLQPHNASAREESTQESESIRPEMPLSLADEAPSTSRSVNPSTIDQSTHHSSLSLWDRLKNKWHRRDRDRDATWHSGNEPRILVRSATSNSAFSASRTPAEQERPKGSGGRRIFGMIPRFHTLSEHPITGSSEGGSQQDGKHSINSMPNELQQSSMREERKGSGKEEEGNEEGEKRRGRGEDGGTSGGREGKGDREEGAGRAKGEEESKGRGEGETDTEDEGEEGTNVESVFRRPAASRLPLSAVVRRCNHEWYMATLAGAESGDAQMQMLLGQMMIAGYGTGKNVEEGYKWLEKAAEGDKEAKVLLKAMRDKDARRRSRKSASAEN